jgi:hypothetical protein
MQVLPRTGELVFYFEPGLHIIRERSSVLLIAVALLGLAGCAEHLGAFEPLREVACFQAARVSLREAIATAEGGNGRAIDADYRQDEELGCLQNDPGAYDITLLAGNRIEVVSVDARTRQVGPREPAGVLSALLGGERFEGSPSDMVRIVPRLGIDISQAIGIAEQQGGKAMVAWVEAKQRTGLVIRSSSSSAGGCVTWVDGERGTE